jgi:hypothetical protein
MVVIPTRKPISSAALDDDDVDYAVVKPHKTITLKKDDKSQHYRDLLIKCQQILERLASWKAMQNRPHQMQILKLLEELREGLQ